MLIGLSHDYLMSFIDSEKIFKQGNMIVTTGGVKRLIRDGQWIRGVVKNSKGTFKVILQFDAHNKVKAKQCDCLEGTQGLICRHIAAILHSMRFDIPEKMYHSVKYDNLLDFVVNINQVTSSVDNATTNTPPKQKEIPYPFTKLLESTQIDKKTPLKLSVHIVVDKDDANISKNMQWKLSLKLGVEKLYIVKSIKSLLESIQRKMPLTFGQNFTYDPKVHSFSSDQTTLIDFLMSLKSMYRRKENSPYYYDTYESYVHDKIVTLDSDYFIKQLMSSLTIPFDFEINTTAFSYKSQVHAVRRDFPQLQTIVTKTHEDREDSNLNVLLTGYKGLFPLTQDYEYVFYQEEIYQLSASLRDLIHQTHQMILRYGDTITVSSDHTEHFMTQVYPQLSRTNHIVLPKDYEVKLIQEPLVTKVFFERTKTGGTLARIKFLYGNLPMEQENKDVKESNVRYVIKDQAAENEILSFFTDFEQANDGYVQDNEQLMYSFVQTRLEPLKEKAEVYYEKGMMPLKGSFPKVKSSISLTTDAYLEVGFEGLTLSSLELTQLYHGLKEKKTFVRLSNGSFIDMQNPEIDQYFDIVKELNLPIKELAQNRFEVPLSRAFAFEKLSKTHHLDIDKHPSYNNFLQRFHELDSLDIPLAPHFQTIMRPYQKSGFYWLSQLYHFKLGGILADDMGLGKTLQAIALIDDLSKKDPRSCLIISPTSLVYNWEAEVKKFAPNLNLLVINGTREERLKQLTVAPEGTIIVTSYTLAMRDIEEYKTREFACCIIDEAQNIKNPNAKTTHAVKQIKASGYFALTGTPIENNLSELWSIFDFIMPGYLLSHSKFQETYEKPIASGNQEALDDLKRHITPFILRRMKKDVLKELPPKIETKSIAHMTKEQQHVYMAYLEKAKQSMEEDIATQGYGQSKIKIFSYLTRLRQICCHPETFIENYEGGSGKLDLLQEILIDSIDARHKVLVFSQFTSMLAIIKRMLEHENISYDYLDGATPSKDRHTKVVEFNAGSTQVFLISLKAGGTGLNLTGADIVIHFDPWWNPAVEDQATDRCYRIGQTNRVQVFKLIAQGTIEDKIYELQQRKKDMIASVIEPGETLLNKLSEDEIRNLFA